MSSIRKKFSRNLAKMRIAKGWTQEELAERLGISVRYVQQLEGKNTPNVKLDTIAVLAQTFRVSPKEFLED